MDHLLPQRANESCTRTSTAMEDALRELDDDGIGAVTAGQVRWPARHARDAR